MREIKYKAFDKVKGEWLDSDELIYQAGCWFEDFRALEGYVALSVENGDVTIVQFTGLTDRNDVEIYEGDIIKVFVYGDDILEGTDEIAEEWNATVSFNDGRFVIDSIPSGESLYYYVNYDFGECEVIGNIYEHPHLLEGVE